MEEKWRLHVDTFAQRVSRGKWIPYPWLVFMLRYIEKKIRRGNARIIVTAPPRHGKSESISHWLPTWFLDLFPDRRVIEAAYGQDFAKKWGRLVRNHFAEKNNQLFTQLHPDQTLAMNWATTRDGGMRSSGLDGTITGEGFDLGIIDDPHKNWEEAMSPAKRRHAIEWFNGTFYTRAEPNASIILMATRWHERDLPGYLINESEEEWEVINLPALAEEGDLLGREPGEALCPERYTKERLERIRGVIGSHMFNALYQQHPSPPDGGYVNRDWFKRYTVLPDHFDKQIQSWDLTFSDTGSSYVVGQVWGRKEADVFLLDQIRGKFTFPETLKQIQILSNRWPDAIEKLVERKANGAAVLDTLRGQVQGLIPVEPRGSKEARLASVSGMIEAGNVHVPCNSLCKWSNDFIEEAITFPAGNDDQVDAMTQALDRLRKVKYDFNISLSLSGSRSNPWEFAHGKVS
jgi:predicted phage terminase large subunit-like protein